MLRYFSTVDAQSIPVERGAVPNYGANAVPEASSGFIFPAFLPPASWTVEYKKPILRPLAGYGSNRAVKQHKIVVGISDQRYVFLVMFSTEKRPPRLLDQPETNGAGVGSTIC